MPESNSTPLVRPCQKCGTADRYADGHCKECKRIYLNKRYTDNPKKFALIKDVWRKANPEKDKEIKARHYKNNADKVKAKSEAYRAANPVSTRAAVVKWNIANPGARRIYNQNRRARQEDAGGKLSSGLAERLFRLQKGLCACCHQPLGDNYQMDHKMPIALGGTNTDDNIQLLRKRCNAQKGMKHPVDFMQSRGFLL